MKFLALSILFLSVCLVPASHAQAGSLCLGVKVNGEYVVLVDESPCPPTLVVAGGQCVVVASSSLTPAVRACAPEVVVETP